jgi:hypothetical protein
MFAIDSGRLDGAQTPAPAQLRRGLVSTRKALPRSAFLHRRHPIGAGDRFGGCQAHLADISADGFARNGRLRAISAMGIRHDGARDSDEK